MSLQSLGRGADGLEQRFGYDAAADCYVLRTTFDNAPTLERNKRLAATEGFGKSKDLWLAASIPVGVQYEWLVRHGVNLWDTNHRGAVKRLLNDSEYRYLRVNHFII